MITFIPMLG